MALIITREGVPALFRNIYKGASVFYIGGGPSLLNQDLALLERRGICTFAVNNIAAKNIRPNIWCCSDNVRSFHESIWLDPAILKFCPSNFGQNHFQIDGKNSMLAARDCPNVFQYHLKGQFNHNTYLVEDHASWGCDRGQQDSIGYKGGRSVMLAAIKLIYYLGFRHVYLLGCDFNMEHDSEIRKGKGKTYAFSQYKHAGGCATNNECYKIMNERFKALQPIFQEKGFIVRNCTPNSRLDSFPVMRLDEAVEEALTRSKFPRKISTFGYYGGRENLNKHGW